MDYTEKLTRNQNRKINQNKNKIIVHTTSAGTQGIANAKNAKEILTGSLVNAKAVAKYRSRRVWTYIFGDKAG